MRKSISTILMILCAASLAMAQAKTGAYSDKPVEVSETPAVQETVSTPATEETVKTEQAAEIAPASEQVASDDASNSEEYLKEVKAKQKETFEKLTKGSYKVKGKPDIGSFFEALIPALGWGDYAKSLKDLEDEVFIDRKNGYASYSQEGCGSLRISCCYWNRTDKKKMLGVYYCDHDLGPKDEVTISAFVTFFVYNEKTQMIEAIEAPFDKPLTGEGYLVCQLPQKGKDIQYRFADDDKDANSDKEPVFTTLYFDGMKFSHTPAKK